MSIFATRTLVHGYFYPAPHGPRVRPDGLTRTIPALMCVTIRLLCKEKLTGTAANKSPRPLLPRTVWVPNAKPAPQPLLSSGLNNVLPCRAGHISSLAKQYDGVEIARTMPQRLVVASFPAAGQSLASVELTWRAPRRCGCRESGCLSANPPAPEFIALRWDWNCSPRVC